MTLLPKKKLIFILSKLTGLWTNLWAGKPQTCVFNRESSADIDVRGVWRLYLAKDEVVRPEDLTVGAWANRVHGSGLQVHQNGSGHIPPYTNDVSNNLSESIASLPWQMGLDLEVSISTCQDGGCEFLTTGGLIEVDVDPLKLKIAVSIVAASGINSVLICTGNALQYQLTRFSTSIDFAN